ncbi:hypothetical protein BST28_07390 [Mycolicibacter kumamotonensis]|uniref:A-factor biosynthesis hotdog domain-containing protein n=3 Tax=Mycobacteriaceae TaxID=1762 RepID=A0A1X1W6D6_MYCIR|nr:AfsA-related hotdog domain-containing protein [Mycolicibacterium iranicum]ORA81350.1 hypothetical protein BST28_07390 [Mycolicibacter kumamotonensis]ORV82177.1 hypothetical protein AWC12_00830 [Mycolicibacterium iranicum]
MVPRGLVHKRAIEEVLLCDYKQLGPNEYLVAAQLPRCHSYFSDVCLPYYDFTALGEVMRQSGLLTGHCFHDVPPGTHYIFRKVSGKNEREDVETMRIGDTPTDLLVHYSVRNLRLRRNRLTSFEAFGQMYANGAYVGSGYGFCQLLPPDSYGAMRDMMRDPEGAADRTTESPDPVSVEPLDPVMVGRRDVRNVVIGAFASGDTPDTYTAGLVIRPDHRVFFDHPQDHVPGPLLIEAIRQQALRAACVHHNLHSEKVYIAKVDIEFSSFLELDAPTAVTAKVGALRRSPDGGELTVTLTIGQSGTIAAESALTVIALD